MSILDKWRAIEKQRRGYRYGILFLERPGDRDTRKRPATVLRLVFDGQDVEEFSQTFDSDSVLFNDPRYDFDGHLI